MTAESSGNGMTATWDWPTAIKLPPDCKGASGTGFIVCHGFVTWTSAPFAAPADGTVLLTVTATVRTIVEIDEERWPKPGAQNTVVVQLIDVTDPVKPKAVARSKSVLYLGGSDPMDTTTDTYTLGPATASQGQLYLSLIHI